MSLATAIEQLEMILNVLRSYPSSRMLAVSITQLEGGLLWLKATKADQGEDVEIDNTFKDQ
jgi:hypothetical protein